jgi:xylulokinase
LKAVVECIAACVAKAKEAGVASNSLKAVCVSSLYGGSGVPVDSDMRPLYPCLIWMDRRATEQVEWVRNNVDLERLYTITGNGVDSYYGYTKMLWLRDHEPDVWSHTRYFLPPNAYVIYMLTGEVAVDHSSAGNIGGIYDIAKRDWSDEALDMLGIPATMMPERLVDSSEVVGGLLSQWVEQLGLDAGTAIVAGGVDAAVLYQPVRRRTARVDQHAACVQRAARYLRVRRRDYGGRVGDVVSRAVLSGGDRGRARDTAWRSASLAGRERFSDSGWF